MLQEMSSNVDSVIRGININILEGTKLLIYGGGIEGTRSIFIWQGKT